MCASDSCSGTGSLSYGQVLLQYQCERCLLQGAILNRTYGTHKNLFISLFLLRILGPIYYGPP